MDQNKIKDCFNSVNIPVLPRCDELLTNYEFSHKNKFVKLNFKVMYIGIITIILSLTLIFIIGNFNDNNPTYKNFNINTNSFNLIYGFSYNQKDDNYFYLNFNEKIKDAEYKNVQVKINYVVNDGAELKEFTQTIDLNCQKEIQLCEAENNTIEKINVVEASGNVEIENETYESLMKETEIINSFYQKLNSYESETYKYFYDTTTKYYEVDFDAKKNEITDTNYDFTLKENYLGYHKDDYYRLDYNYSKGNTNYTYNFVVMNYQNRPCFISNVNHKTPNGKLGIKLNFYDSIVDAKDTMYGNYVNFDFNSFKNLLNNENLNLSSITIDNISTNEEVKANIYKYKLTGLFKEFYKLDEKLFSDSPINQSTYRKFFDDQISLIITMDNKNISFNLSFENKDNILAYVTNIPLTPGEKVDPDKMQIVKKFEYSINLNEKYTFESFDETKFDNFVDNDEKYTYLPALSLNDVYKEEKVNSLIHIESFYELNTTYHKLYLTKGQYILQNVNTSSIYSYRDIQLYDELGVEINLGIHINDTYFHNLSRTFTVFEEGYYYIAVEGGGNEIDIRIDQIENDSLFDVDNPILINSNNIDLNFDNNYDIFYYDYYSEEDGIININLSNSEIYVFAFDKTMNRYRKYSQSTLNNGTSIGIQKGSNTIIFCLDPSLEIENIDIKCNVQFIFLGGNNGYSNDISLMPNVTGEYFNNTFSPIYNHPIYLKLVCSQNGQYTFNIDQNTDKIEYAIYDSNNVKISKLFNDTKLILNEGTYIIKAVIYYFDIYEFNIKYIFSEEIEEQKNYVEFEYDGGNRTYEYQFPKELSTKTYEFHITFKNDYIVKISNYKTIEFDLTIYELNGRQIVYSDVDTIIKQGTYIFTFTISETLITPCPKLIILERTNSRNPYDSSNESYLLINNTITNYNYDNITQISECSVQYSIKDCESKQTYLVFKVEQECSVTITNNSESQISVGNNRILPNESRTTIYFEGLVLIKISGIVSNLDITITLN